jgi:UDP-N-acetylmuramoyl-tripeptide--D-alanyl-D-alanine ligase
MDIQSLHEKFLACSGVSTDTRKIDPGAMFFAIRGDRFDANAFAAEALEKGAAFVVIDNPDYLIDARTILVEDSLKALQRVAAHHRKFLRLPIVSLTGSNGKTTTKELIQAVLSEKFRTKATSGNLNNHIGVPLTLLSFTGETEIGIVEMGANHRKEIEFLCNIVQPDYGYITNFGRAHLEGFGGVDGVISGKSEMYDYLRSAGKLAFVNLDDPIQAEKTADIRRFTFAQHVKSDLCISAVSASPMVKLTFGATEISSRLIGLYNANNIAAAAAIGKYFGVPDDDIRTTIESYTPANNRSQLLNKGTNEIILDAYNANPSSVAVALDNLIQLAKPNKIAILGDMFELGADSLAEHRAIVEKMLDARDIRTVFIGKDYYASRQEAPNVEFYGTFDEFVSVLQKNPVSNASLLIKGSRGMALERILEFL